MSVWLSVWWLVFHGLFAQGTLPMGSTATGNPYPAPAAGSQLWISADCVILTGVTCSTLANGGTFTTVTQSTWADRSANAAPMNVILANESCVLNTNQQNGMPAVNFVGGGTNCFFTLSGPVDVASTTTTWTIFAVIKNAATAHTGFFNGGPAGVSQNPNSFSYATFSGGESVASNAALTISQGTAAQDTSFHVLSCQYTIGTGVAFTIDGATDTSIGFTNTAITGHTTFIGATQSNNALTAPFNGLMYELLIYSSATTPLSGANITTTLNYLRHKYGQI